MSAPRRILLVDADAFFVAVARLADPEGAGKARLLIVGGSPEGRGVVTSASYEARQYGVRSAMPMARALRLCPKAMRVGVPYALCRQKSREIRAVLERFAPVVAAASIDEWYLDLGGTEALYGDEPLEETARRIRAAVIAETSLSVSIGGGTSRLVAKLAVERAKPKPGTGADGVHVVPPGEEAAFLRGFMLADIPGVGPKLQQRLARVGLESVPDLLAADPAMLARLTNERTATWLRERCLGRDDTPVRPRERAKSISRDETFPRDLHTDAELERELWRLVVRAASDLRQAGLEARTVTVRLRDADFTTRQASRTVATPISSERAIGALAMELLRRLRRARRVGARLVGVGLSGFGEPGQAVQLPLFEDTLGMRGVPDAAAPAPVPPPAPLDPGRERALAATLDEVRRRFGRSAIVPGALVGEDGVARVERAPSRPRAPAPDDPPGTI